MSITQRLYATSFAFLDAENQGSNVHSGNTIVLKTTKDSILFKFEDIPSALRFKRISSLKSYVYAISIETYDLFWLNVDGITKAFNPETVTFELWRGTPDEWFRQGDMLDPRYLPKWAENSATSKSIPLAAMYGIEIYGKIASTSKFKNLAVATAGQNRPYIEIIIDESATADTLSIIKMSPNAGAIDKSQDVLFTWGAEAPYPCVPKLVQSSATFQWRTVPNGTIHSSSISGNTSSFTVPAGTFTGTSIQWRIIVTANSGKTTTSDWKTLSTADAISVASAISPNGEIVDTTAPVAFTWSHIISTGTQQTKAELQLSADKQTWSALATVTGAETTYTAPPNTLGSGTKYWRVRTYNTDNAAGAWSEPAEFICVGAPAAPIVSIRAQTPRPVVGWQSAEQLAYQVKLAGQPISSVYYGTEKTWTSPTYLPDGAYTVRVRVQNEYGLWSPWGEAALQVVNVPGAALSLTVEAEDAALLAWQTTGSYDFFLIYRDGRLIGRTTERSFTDSASVGAVRYQVRGCYGSSANYGLSPEVAATIAVQYITLSDMDTGAILPLPYSESAHRTTSRTRKQEVQAVQLAGRAYPVIERSEHMAQSISVACAFYTQEDCAALEDMLGHLVTVRTPEGRMVTGCLAQLTERTDGGFYSVYTFSVDQADWEEAIRVDA